MKLVQVVLSFQISVSSPKWGDKWHLSEGLRCKCKMADIKRLRALGLFVSSSHMFAEPRRHVCLGSSWNYNSNNLKPTNILQWNNCTYLSSFFSLLSFFQIWVSCEGVKGSLSCWEWNKTLAASGVKGLDLSQGGGRAPWLAPLCPLPSGQFFHAADQTPQWS